MAVLIILLAGIGLAYWFIKELFPYLYILALRKFPQLVMFMIVLWVLYLVCILKGVK